MAAGRTPGLTLSIMLWMRCSPSSRPGGVVISSLASIWPSSPPAAASLVPPISSPTSQATIYLAPGRLRVTGHP